MKRKVFFLFVLLICCQAAFAYDFSAVSPSGQTLYYIINGCEVTVTYPNNSNTSWVGYSSPVGNLIIPNTVTYSGTTYSVTGIRNGAFHQCSGLTSVTIPNSVVSIGSYAFGYCTGLTSVTIPNSVASIGSCPFEGCTGLTSVAFNADSCTFDLTSYGAFSNCTNITSFTIGNNVKAIPNYLCCGLTGLTSVTIPNSVVSIGHYAFGYCTGLTSVTIPDSVVSIGEGAFKQCTGLTSVVFNADSCTYADDLYSDNVFSNCINIVSFTFGNNVKVIPNCLCCNLTGLTSVTIPNSVTSIGRSAFKQCTGLTSVVFNADSCTYAGYYYSSNYNETWAFKGCTNITSFSFGNNVKAIPNYLCCSLTGLTSVTIPNSVTSIGDFAFDRCSGLTAATIGDSVISIGWAAFYKCSGLTSVTIGNSVTSIGDAAFEQCTSLTSVTIPNSVTSIGSSAFKQCTGLTSVTIPNSVNSIGSNAFNHCTGLTAVVFNADSCTYAGNSNRAFIYCTNITSFTFGNNVKVIPNYLCYNLTGLTSVTIPNSVISIGNGAFQQCSGLTSATIGNSVISIGESAFKGCSGLTSVTIPNSVTSIGGAAFYGCSSLQEITFLNPTPPNCGNNILYGTPSGMVVNIPCGSLALYVVRLPNNTNFVEQMFEFSVMSDDESKGTVQILTEPSCTNHNALLYAVPANGYCFDHWNTGSTDNPYTLTVTSDTTITAFFVETYTVTVLVDNPATGSISGDGTYGYGSSVTITAYPADGYRFVHWSTGSTDNPYTITVTSDTTITAFFEEYVPETYTVTVLVDSPGTGSVTGGGVYEEGTSVTITAYPADGYRFDHWSTGSTDNPYTLTVTTDTTIIGYFVSNSDINETEENDIHISVLNGQICVEGVVNEEVRVYDITGRLVRNHSLPTGVYLVKVGTLPARKAVVIR